MPYQNIDATISATELQASETCAAIEQDRWDADLNGSE